MRTARAFGTVRPVRARLLPLLLALSAAAPIQAAQAEVPVGPGGELLPRTGPELLEAAGTARGDLQGDARRIVLGERVYRVGRSVVLAPGTRLEGAGAGDSRIVGVGPTAAVLRLGSGAQASGFSLGAEGEAEDRLALIELTGAGQLSDAVVFVPDSLPNASAATLTGTGNVMRGVELESEALAPAVRAAAGSEIAGGSSITGGDPALAVVGQGPGAPAGAAAGTVTVGRTIIQGGASSGAVVTATAAGAPLTLRLQSAQIRGGATDAALLDLPGATSAAGSLTVDLQSSTLIGAETSTAVRVQQGAESTATTVRLSGLLALGARTAIACGPAPRPAAAPVVTIAGVFRDGALAPGAPEDCAVRESGRRTGEPRFRDPDNRDYTPTWGSVLIDGVAEHAEHPTDALGGPRTSVGPATPAATPTDIGSIEYPYTPPAIDELVAKPVDDAGLLEFSAVASDGEPAEQDALQSRWTFPDGSTADGPQARWRATSPGPLTAFLTVTDVSGLVVTQRVTVTPTIATPTSTPTPTLTPDEQQTLPERVTLPRPTPPTATPRPGSGPQAPLADLSPTITLFERAGARIRATGRRPSGPGPVARGEAEVTIEARRAATALFTIRRRTGGRDAVLARARFQVDLLPGRRTVVHLTSRFGPTRLRPGLHRVVVLVQPASGIVERRELLLRVVR